MTSTRFLLVLAAAATLLAAQLDSTARRVTEAALTLIAADFNKTPQARKLMFDPAVFSQYWSDSVGRVNEPTRRKSRSWPERSGADSPAPASSRRAPADAR
jgi:hypothetical protein